MALSAPAGTLLLLFFLSSLLHGCSPSSTTEECTGVRLRSFTLMSKCNSTTLNDKQIKEVQSSTTVLYIPIVYIIAFTLGLPANLLALWVLLFRTKKLPSTILLINLTATDLMILMVLPFRIVYHLQGNDWAFGEPFCRVVMALFYGNMYGSVLCLAFIAVDRYVALVHPFGAKTLRSRRTSFYMSLCVWVVVLAAMLPLLISRQSYTPDEPRITTCHDALPEVHKNYFLPYFLTLFFLSFLLPLLVVLYCYVSVIRTLVAGGQRYAHAMRVTMLVLVVFVGCLLPSNILLLLHYSDSYLVDNGEDLYVPYMVSLAVSTLNSCINPFIFYYISDDFRDKVMMVLCCRGNNGRDSSTGNQVAYSSSLKGTQRSKGILLSMSSQRPGTSEGEAA